MPRLRYLLPLSLLLVACAASAQSFLPADDAVPEPPKPMHSLDLTSIDKTADPCVNFYEYACGNWRKNNPIPADQSRWGTFNLLQERNEYLLYTELKEAADKPADALDKQFGDYFAACMNTDAIEKRGAEPLEPTLHAIAALDAKAGLAALLGNRALSVDGFAGFGSRPDFKNSSVELAVISQGGLTLPDRDYYLLDDAHMQDVRAKYKAYMETIFKLIGDDSARAEQESADVLRIETALAKAALPRVALRNPDNVYHPMPVSALATLTPEFDWSAYFHGLDTPTFTTINVAEPDFFKAMNTLIAEEPLPAIKSYLRFHAANGMATELSHNFDDAHFDFFGKVLQGQAVQRARWKRCTAQTDEALGEEVGRAWVARNFPPEAKANMEKLVAALREALGADIEQLTWMSDATKKEAELKLAAFRQKIGYPDKWRDYTAVIVKRDDYAGNVHRAQVFNREFRLDHIGKPVNEREWGMTPPTVNAYYNASMNDINFPAGILQPPFYDFSKDPAVNFGGIGVVIGHEMTHGFDDQGSKFDAQGNVRSWWTPEDRTKFEARTDCEVKEYGSFEPVKGEKLNGKLTLGENTADNGGIRVAYQAMHTVLAKEGPGAETAVIDGYTPDQRFFIAFGQVWCSNIRDEYERVAIKTDPHSPGEFRTNGTVQNFPAFGKAFGCHVGQPMMPADACRVW